MGKSGKHKFEVIANQGAILQYREGKIPIHNVLLIDQIFTNSARGDIANPGDLETVFGTEDVAKCCEEIVKRGDIQYTASERKKFTEDKMTNRRKMQSNLDGKRKRKENLA